MNLSEIPKHIQAACLYIGLPVLKRMGISIEMKDVCRELEVEHISILNQVRLITQKIFSQSSPGPDQKHRELQKLLNEKSFLSDIFEYQALHPSCWSKIERHQMTDDFKNLIVIKKEEYDLSWGDVSRLLKVPEDTLKKFKGQSAKSDDDDDTPGSSLLPDHVLEKLSQFVRGRTEKASVKVFCEKNPDVLEDLKMSYRSFSKLLLRLGYVSPKGIFLQNTGLDLIKRFSPNIVWGTDGKNMNLVINGEPYRWVWQCLIDYKTTVLVGGVINESETTDNLLAAISISQQKTGVSPMAIVLDNRLSENLPAIQAYLSQFGVEIIKTFPGNSKSNGIIENNFRVFENWVHGRDGKIIINAKNNKELSYELAQLLTEIFTQLRNCAPRKSLSGRSARDNANNATPLSTQEASQIRDEIKALANRLKNELATPIMTAAKEEALKVAITTVNPPSPDVFRKRLNAPFFTGDLILQAVAIYKTQQQKHPEKKFDHTYFGGILRNLADQENLRMLHLNIDATYREFWNGMEEKIQSGLVKAQEPIESCESLVKEFLFTKIPAQGTLALLYLKNLMFYLTGQNPTGLPKLREELTAKILKEKMAPFEKRELLIRKVSEIETYIRLIAKVPEIILKNTTQVFLENYDGTVTT